MFLRHFLYFISIQRISPKGGPELLLLQTLVCCTNYLNTQVELKNALAIKISDKAGFAPLLTALRWGADFIGQMVHYLKTFSGFNWL